jgi:hypothetical protein
MFVQIISGKTSDAQALRGRFDEWTKTVQSGAEGWRGSTAGVGDDGTFIATAMFESEEAARRNSDRPEQGEWWSQTEQLIQNPQFTDVSDAMVALGGADPTAGFVQVMQGKILDQDLASQMMKPDEAEMSSGRSDVTGMVICPSGDRFTTLVYFTDEASARAGESNPSAQDSDRMDQFGKAFGDMTYIDLHEPWHYSA